MKFLTNFCLCIFLFSCMGCGSNPVLVGCAGTVTLDGEPLSGASISLSNISGMYNATTDQKGRFEVVYVMGGKSYEGCKPGIYRVAIAKREPNPHLLPDMGQVGVEQSQESKENREKTGQQEKSNYYVPMMYADPSTSGIEIEVPAGGKDDIRIVLITPTNPQS